MINSLLIEALSWISFCVLAKRLVTDKPEVEHQTTAPMCYSILTVMLFFVAVVLLTAGLLGQQSWAAESKLTKEFELCIETAPFKATNRISQSKQLNPDDLQKHFDEFDQIFRETGLPPIWDGAKLVPWRIYHQESIMIAQACHESLGITQPQQQLRGTYAKPVWDPRSEIWMDRSRGLSTP